jgi:membrane protein DedA with SNARE-associated domain
LNDLIEIVEKLATYWVGELQDWGFWGIFILMAIESSVIPLPSEIVMLPAGALAAQGKMNLGSAIAAGTLGSLAGSLCNYYFALYFGRAFLLRYGRYFFLPPDKIEWAEREWQRHGEMTTFVCRLLPVIRHLISIPAGLARMDLLRFCIWTTAGAGLWVTILTLTGYYFGDEALVLWEHYKREITIGLFGGGAIVVAIYILRHRMRASKPAAEGEAP